MAEQQYQSPQGSRMYGNQLQNFLGVLSGGTSLMKQLKDNVLEKLYYRRMQLATEGDEKDKANRLQFDKETRDKMEQIEVGRQMQFKTAQDRAIELENLRYNNMRKLIAEMNKKWEDKGNQSSTNNFEVYNASVHPDTALRKNLEGMEIKDPNGKIIGYQSTFDKHGNAWNFDMLSTTPSIFYSKPEVKKKSWYNPITTSDVNKMLGGF